MAILLSIEPQDIAISAIRKLFIMKGCIRNKKEVLLVAFNVWLKRLKVKLSLEGSMKGDSETHSRKENIYTYLLLIWFY